MYALDKLFEILKQGNLSCSKNNIRYRLYWDDSGIDFEKPKWFLTKIYYRKIKDWEGDWQDEIWSGKDFNIAIEKFYELIS